MTIKLRAVPPGEGYGAVTNINLPGELDAGDWITGVMNLTNNGEADKMALVFNTVWNGKMYGIVLDMTAGEVVEIGIDAGLIHMPNHDAVINILGCHAEVGGELAIDGVEFKIDEWHTH